MRVISKIAKSDQTLEMVQAAQAEYKDSEEFKKWCKDNEVLDDEDLPLTDPEGWELYAKATEKPYQYMLDFAQNVAQSNPEDVQLQAKCLLYFIKADKPELAMKAA